MFSYLCGERYDPDSGGGIRWNDPDINVKWLVGKVGKMILSKKDKALPLLREFVRLHGALSC